MKWSRISVLAPSLSVWQPWESCLTTLSFNYSSVKGQNKDVHNSDMHRSQAESIQEGGRGCCHGDREGHWCTEEQVWVSGSSQAACQPVLPYLVSYFSTRAGNPDSNFWLVSQINHSMLKWGLWASLWHTRSPSQSCEN